MFTLLKPIQVREELLGRGLKVFTPLVFLRIFNVSPARAKYFLEKQSKKGGLFLRLKKGLYALRTDLPSEEEIAARLYAPSYISFEYALSRFGIIPEAVYTVTSATTKSTREFVVEDKKFAYFTIKKQAYTGFNLVQNGEKHFFLAEPEKALVDYLYFVSLGLKKKNNRLVIGGLDRNKIRRYAEMFDRKNLMIEIEKELL